MSTPAAASIEGCFDGIDGFDLYGWAWSPDAPAEQVEIEVVSLDRVVGKTIAVRFRNDLADNGKRGGACAFRIAIGRLGLGGASAEVRVRAGGTWLSEALTLPADLVVAAEIHATRLSADDDATSEPGQAGPTQPPVRFSEASGILGWIERFDARGVMGWAYDPRTPGKGVSLAITHRDQVVGRIDASKWRDDLAELRQGDGRAGFEDPPPASLCDGQWREIDIRLWPDGPSVLDRRLQINLPAASASQPKPDAIPRRRNRLLPRAMEFTFIVNFYNMRREAERTLASLSRSYQRDVDDIDYEVIAVDNGSAEPLDPAWVESFGPEFRLVQPSRRLPSPCFALNEAARSAKGKRLGLMIDGAHVLTPGVVREALDAFVEAPNSVVGLRQWFIGGDQRWLSSQGYSRDAEDIAFGHINWPHQGYRLFEVATPMMPSPNPWFDSAAESNCLMLPADLFVRLGGYDEAFSEPGGSLANLDLYSRAVEAAGDGAVMLIGEASFHQYHGGTTTNVDEEQKNAEVRRYFNEFRHRRGYELKSIESNRIRLRGRLPHYIAAKTRQRPGFPIAVGITPATRPTDRNLYFDDGAELYLQNYAQEAGVMEKTRWRGEPTGVAAGDLTNLQEIIGALRPTRILNVNARRGLSLFLGDVLRLLAIPDAELVCVGGDPPEAGATILPGPIMAAATLAAIRSALGAAEDVLVVFRADDDDALPVEAVRAYMQFVSPQSFFIFTGTTDGQPWLGYSNRWRRKAVQLLTGLDSDFRIDHSWEFQLVTGCAWGYLRRVGPVGTPASYDPALDDMTRL